MFLAGNLKVGKTGSQWTANGSSQSSLTHSALFSLDVSTCQMQLPAELLVFI